MADRRTAHRKGLEAEAEAARLYEAEGARILARRFKTPFGEIDLICAEPGGAVVFVEVKARRGLDQALEALTPRQARRMEAAALVWIAAQGFAREPDLRFDLVAAGDRGAPRRLKNVWLASGL